MTYEYSLKCRGAPLGLWRHAACVFLFIVPLLIPAASWSASPTASPTIPPSPLPPPSPEVLEAVAVVCGDRECEWTFEPYGETCGNCPADCGPCQPLSDVTSCVENYVYVLAFEGGPSTVDPSLLATLLVFGVKATFFLVGDQLQAFNSIFYNIASAGHSIFGHTYSGEVVLGQNLSDYYAQLGNTTSAFLVNQCTRPLLYRAPLGEMDNNHRALSNLMGYRIVKWNIDTWDVQYAATNTTIEIELFTHNLTTLFPTGAIQLAHDTNLAYAAVVPAIIRAVLARGYEFVSLERCVWGPQYQLHPSWVYAHAGCGSAANWTTIARTLQKGVRCPVSEWSAWSPCNARCGNSTQTRVRYALPPSLEISGPECVGVDFMQSTPCTGQPLCPQYVWNNTYTNTDGGGWTLGSAWLASLPLTVCGFSQWRWANTSTTLNCSKPCGQGIVLQVRDYAGFGPYSPLCGPLVQWLPCNNGPCYTPPPAKPKYFVALEVLIGMACIVIVALLLGWTFFQIAARTCSNVFIVTSMDLYTPTANMRSRKWGTRPGVKALVGDSGDPLEHFPISYFSSGKPMGPFMKRKDGHHSNMDASKAAQAQQLLQIIQNSTEPTSVASDQDRKTSPRNGRMSRRRSSMNSLDKNPSSRSRSPPRPPPQPGDPVVFEGEDGDEEGDDANSRADMLSMGVDDEHRSHEDMVYETGDQPWIRSVELSPYFQSNEELRGSPVSPDRLVLMSRRRKQPARSRRKSVKSPRSPGHPLLRMMTQRHITSDADGDGEETIPATHPWNRNRDVGRFLSATRPGRRVRGRERRRSSAAGLDASHTDPWDVSF